MFSSRLPFNLPRNRLSAALADKREAGADLLDLTESNPTRVGLFGDDLSDLLRPLSDRRGLRYDPQPQGSLSARRAISAYYGRRGLDADPDHLVLSASTSEAYSWLFQLLCDVDDVVLYPQPSYPLFEHLAGLSSVRLLPYPLEYDGRWTLDLSALRSVCETGPRAILLVNPNNPTGSYLRREELDALLDLCQTRQIALISDEVFGDYSFGDPARDPGRVPSLLGSGAAERALCFVLSGLSKVIGMPQLKLGWIHVGGPGNLRQAAQERLLLVADTFLSVGTPIQLAADSLLSRQPALTTAIARRTCDNRQVCQEAVRDTACQLLHADGGWSAVLRLPRVLSEEEWVLRLLAEDDVVVYPGYFFDFPEEAYLVVSLLPEPPVFAEAMRRLVARVAAA
jgi:aspartate/methionine/tyrosine aminotransferase